MTLTSFAKALWRLPCRRRRWSNALAEAPGMVPGRVTNQFGSAGANLSPTRRKARTSVSDSSAAHRSLGSHLEFEKRHELDSCGDTQSLCEWRRLRFLLVVVGSSGTPVFIGLEPVHRAYDDRSGFEPLVKANPEVVSLSFIRSPFTSISCEMNDSRLQL
jgi:hypothetical protein